MSTSHSPHFSAFKADLLECQNEGLLSKFTTGDLIKSHTLSIDSRILGMICQVGDFDVLERRGYDHLKYT